MLPPRGHAGKRSHTDGPFWFGLVRMALRSVVTIALGKNGMKEVGLSDVPPRRHAEVVALQATARSRPPLSGGGGDGSAANTNPVVDDHYLMFLSMFAMRLLMFPALAK